MWNPVLVGRLRQAMFLTTHDGDAGLRVRAARLSRRVGLLLLRDRTLMSWLQAVPFLAWAGYSGGGMVTGRVLRGRSRCPALFPCPRSVSFRDRGEFAWRWFWEFPWPSPGRASGT